MDEEDQNDIAELEAKLYAQIHHEAVSADSPNVIDMEPIPNSVNTVTNDSKKQQQPTADRTVTKNRVINNTNAKQHVGHQFGSTQGGISASNFQQQTTTNRNYIKKPISSNLQQIKQKETTLIPTSTITSNESRPKPFTPYTSYLSQVGLSTTPLLNEKIEKPNVIQKFQNPFNRINEKKLNKLLKLKAKQKKAIQAKRNLITTTQKINKVIINLETSSEDEDDENYSQKTDDDVVCVPTPPPPLVCIDSSDEEDGSDSPVNDNDNKTEVLDDTTLVDPSLPEDFIGQRDRRRLSERSSDLCDPTGDLDDEELAYICATVENAVQESSTWKDTDDISSSTLSKNPIITQNVQTSSNKPKESNYVFATPNEALTKSYEVSDKSFAAVDVYESESSDIPESIYHHKIVEKKLSNNSDDSDSDSDCSEVQINTINRSKRMLKRKSSGSTKGSDYAATDDDENENDGAAFVNLITNTSTPHIKKGEAVNNAKSILRKTKKTKILPKKLSKISECQQSDEEFLSMLSCIVHVDKNTNANTRGDGRGGVDTTGEISTDISQLESSQNLSEPTVLARDIVEHVLKKSSSKKNNENNDQQHQNDEEGKLNNEWIVKDQFGETDDNNMPTAMCLNEVISVTDCKKMKKQNLTEKKLIITNDEDKKRENFSVQSCSLFDDLNDPEIGWNDEMKCFYNKSWGGETYNQNAILRQMSSKPIEWIISPEDLYADNKNKRRQRATVNVRCHNCRELGHRYSDCHLPPKKINCFMCGVPGHREARCPNTLCLRCGNKTRVFSKGCFRCNAKNHIVCHTCKANGHMSADCPDKWRRYHSTILPNETLQKLPILQNKRRSCSICTNIGHTAENCQSGLRIFEMPIPKMKISSYNQTYTPILEENLDKKNDSEENCGAPFALLSVPVKNFEFNWDICENDDRIYGRIIKATNIKREAIQETISTDHDETVQLVLNPLNVINKQNITKSTKKKLFTKNCYQEQLIDNQDNVSNNITTTKTETTIDTKKLLNFSFTSAFDKMQQQKTNSFDLGFLMVENIEINTDLSGGGGGDGDNVELMENYNDSCDMVNILQANNQLNEEDKCLNKIKKVSLTKVLKMAKNSADYHVMLNECESDDDENEITNKIHYHDHDSNSNYSFSEYFHKNSTVTSTETSKNTRFEDLTIMPDYIPLGDSDNLNLNDSNNDLSSINTEISIASHSTTEQSEKISIENQNINNEYLLSQSEAKIILTKDHTKFLLTKQGSAFLSEANLKHNIIIRMEWQTIGNILFVKGFPTKQDNFHQELITYLTNAEEKQKKKHEISQQVPKKRTQLIRFIQEQILQLDKQLGNIKDLFFKLRLHEKQKSKIGNRRADQTRRILNMILFGQCGMRDGNMHLAAIQANLRTLIENQQQEFISNSFRNEVFQHYRYIFSPFSHEDYQSLVQQYQNLKFKNQLPQMCLDRKLMGLKLDVRTRCETPPPPSPPRFCFDAESQANDDDAAAAAASAANDQTEDKDKKTNKELNETKQIEIDLALNSEHSKECDNIELVPPSNRNVKSMIWSRKCLQYIDKCILIPQITNNSKAMARLRLFNERAVEDKLTYNEYYSFVKIFDELASRI